MRRPGPDASSSTKHVARDAVVVIVATLVAIALLRPVLALPSKVPTVTVANQHGWHARVEVSDQRGERWLGLGQVPRGHTTTYRNVIDQGDRWRVRFSYVDVTVELIVDRDDLESDGWFVEVPRTFADAMRGAGIGASAEP